MYGGLGKKILQYIVFPSWVNYTINIYKSPYVLIKLIKNGIAQYICFVENIKKFYELGALIVWRD